MIRARTLVVFLFALASILGGTLSGALAAEAVGPSFTIASPLVDECPQEAAVTKHLSFRPCGKLRNGLAIQCHVDDGLVVPAGAEVPYSALDLEPIASVDGDWFFDLEALFRPPRVG